MSKMKILVTDANYKHSLAAVRALGKSGHEIHSYGNAFGMAHFSKFVRRRHFSSKSRDHESQLISIIEREKIDFLLPLSAAMTSIVVNSNTINLKVSTALPDSNQLLIALNKKLTTEIAKKLNINTPISFYPGSFEDLVTMNLDAEREYVIKPIEETSNLEPTYFTLQDIEYKKELLLKYFIDELPIVQEKIVGKGFGYFAVYDNGVCKNWMTHKRLQEYPSSGGPSLMAESYRDKNIESLGAEILKYLNWNGPAMVEFKQDEGSGKYFFLEINPKLWGSLDLCIASGFDVPGNLLRISKMQEVLDCSLEFQPTIFMWPIQGHGTFNNVFNLIAFKLRNKNRIIKSNLSLKDPIPNLIDFFVTKLKRIILFIKQSSLGTLVHDLRNYGPNLGSRKYFSELLGIPFLTPIFYSEQMSFGSAPSNLSKKLMQIFGYNIFIDLRAESSPNAQNSSVTRFFGLNEFLPPSKDSILEIIRMIDLELHEGKRIFIHCREGVGRAPLVMACYLISKGISYIDSVNILKAKRPLVKLNSGQIKFLREFSESLENQANL